VPLAAQGAALSLFSGYSHSAPLGGAIALSGYLPLASGFAARLSAANKTLPLFMGHGTADPVVALSWARLSADVLKQSNISFTFKEYPRLPHSIARQEMADLAAWLKPLVAPPAQM
jgi:phospholipase/carboxylesterase